MRTCDRKICIESLSAVGVYRTVLIADGSGTNTGGISKSTLKTPKSIVVTMVCMESLSAASIRKVVLSAEGPTQISARHHGTASLPLEPDNASLGG
jgi:hypothetical protein